MLIKTMYEDEECIWTVSIVKDDLQAGLSAILGKSGATIELNEREDFERSK
ncbi:hypothetical protein ACSFC1_04485 [Pseudothermotoga sp. U03pept]|uniref:hypothetical protein n=1 Tax=Pseudothermotoga sp. U03pept TaxID=3447012 RepID=UPI003F07CE3C